MSAVLLVDTGAGNLRSVERALQRAGGRVEVSGDPERIRRADKLVVPGQGAFGDCAARLAGGLGEALRAHIDRDRPYLGLCLGMQMLFEESEEAEGVPGLAVLAGRVRRFERDMRDPDEPTRRLKVPHMGWNEVEGAHPSLPERAYFYFVHSYYCEPADAAVTVGVTDYGVRFCAAVARGALLACQFHPEKSGRAGDRLLTGFLEGRWS